MNDVERNFAQLIRNARTTVLAVPATLATRPAQPSRCGEQPSVIQ
jgi:hypothetical protein